MITFPFSRSLPHTLRFLARVSCLLLICGVTSQPNRAQAQWTLVWSDEFNGPNIDLSKWSHEVNGYGGGNNELQYYTARTNNSFIENGNLVIQALAENYSGWQYPPGGGTGPWVTKDYTSARLRTLNKGDWTYGRFEIRARTPTGQGLWPAIWMLPTDSVYGGWAASGEIDIMELLGHQDNKTYGTLHFGGSWPANTNHGGSYVLPSGSFASTFHTFALEWETNAFRWYVDGLHYWTETSWYSSAAAYPAPFNQRFHMLLNVAVGGNWPGSPNGSTVFPQRMEVDYVRVYQKGAPPVFGTNKLVNPGFETNTSGWTVTASGGTVAGSTAYARSGSRSLLIDSTGAGAWSSPQATQTFPASPGNEFNFKGYMLQPTGKPITDGSFGVLKIVFKDAGGNDLLPASASVGQINASFPGVESLPFLNSASPKGSWVLTEAQGVAPAGTTSVTFFLLNVNQAVSPSGMHWDDIQANLVGAPVLPVTVSAALVGSNIQISFPTQNGASYEVAFKAKLTDASWAPIETIPGDGTTKTVFYPANTATGFYTVRTP